MPAALTWAVPAALGAVGLLQNQDSQRRSNNNANRAQNAQDQGLALQNQLAEIQMPAYEEIARLARGYDPQKEAQGSIDQASKIYQSQLSKAINNNIGSQAQSGLGLSTEGMVRGAENLAGPNEAFKAFLADALSNPTAKRAQMLQGVLNQPVGNLAQGYFQSSNQALNLSQAQQPNWGGTTAILSQFLNQFLNKPSASPTSYRRPGGGSSDY